MKIIKLLSIVLVLFSPIYADIITGKTIKITDGDTVHVLKDDYTKEKIRLAGIDTPERKQPFGKKAKHYLASLIGNKRVTIEFNKRDRYGRIVGKVLFQDKDINLEMIRAGLAWHYKKYQKEQSKLDRNLYSAADSFVKTNGVGLFQDSSAIPPWEWRNNKKNLRSIKPANQAQSLKAVNSNTSVWVNFKSGKYHCPDTRYYGNTKRGEMMIESMALKSGFRGAHGLGCN